MIKKYILGTPFETDAVVCDVPLSHGEIPYFERRSDGAFCLELADDDIVYGLGQQVRGINKRGWHYVSNNYDNPNHHEDAVSLYGAHNFLIISGEKLFGIFIDSPERIYYDIGYTKRSQLVISAESYNMKIYIITGASEAEIVTSLRRLTGKSYAAPKWALGYGQSRWGYMSADDIREVAHNHRKNGIPIDSIYLDIDYMERYKDFTVNEETFPDFKNFVAEMRAQDIHIVPIIDAGVKIEEGYSTYEEGVKYGYFCKDEEGENFVAAVWPGRVHFPDVLNSEAREWFGSKYSYLTDMGIEGFWNDMNEPAIFYTEKRLAESAATVNELIKLNMGLVECDRLKWAVGSLSSNPQDYKMFYHNVDGKTVCHDGVHNLYGYNMTRAAYEAFEKISPEKRILIFSRSSYIGSHRYGGIWQGDNKSWWSHLLLNIQMTCNLNMVGYLYTGADTGGFGCDATEDLLLRWLQFSVFTPLMRNHTAIGTRRQEAYNLANADSCKKIIQLRYALLPYIYSEYMKAIVNDSMMFRPLGFEFKDKTSRQVYDQLLLGDEIMLAPVYTQNAEGRYVWLPEEMIMVTACGPENYKLQTLPAGHHYVEVGLENLVFFIRKGKAIPVSKGGESVYAEGLESLEMLGYPDSEYLMYDDDGYTRNISKDNIKKVGKL